MRVDLSGTRAAACVVALASGVLLFAQAAGQSSGAAAPATVSATVDFGSVVQYTDPYAMGIVSSTYGDNPLSSPAQSTAEQTLDARYVRIPVGIRNGILTSSAGGAGAVDVTSLVARYRSWGYHVLAVIGGRTNDFDVQPGDATQVMKALGFNGVDYTGPNEPTNQGKSVQDEVNVATMITNEGRAINPGFRLWGPVWSYYDRASITAFAQGMGSRLAGVDYHHYGMGESSISTAAVMSATPTWGQEVANERADLASFGLPQSVSVDEVNLSWRYDDGTAAANGGDGSGGNRRFFTGVNTVFVASVCGHVLLSGGRCLPYASQNGPLGMTVQGGQINPDNRPVSSPMPGYWGISAWTGAHLWSHMKDSFYGTTSSDPSLEVFAVNNEAGGDNLVLINKSEAGATSLSLALKNLAPGAFATFQSSPSAPYAAPAKIGAGSYTSTVNLTLPAMTVTTVVLQPGTVTAPSRATTAYRIAAGGNIVTGYQSPGALVAGGTAASNAGSTSPPAGVPAQVFQAERYGVQTYTLPVTRDVRVRVRLLFAERYARAQQVGARRFNVTINGVRVATNFDIWSRQGRKVGACAVLTADVQPVNGTVTVALTDGAAGSPTINAVLVDATG